MGQDDQLEILSATFGLFLSLSFSLSLSLTHTHTTPRTRARTHSFTHSLTLSLLLFSLRFSSHMFLQNWKCNTAIDLCAEKSANRNSCQSLVQVRRIFAQLLLKSEISSKLYSILRLFFFHFQKRTKRRKASRRGFKDQSFDV